jgi:DNA-binding MarR family transcriptional regulator
MAEAPPDEVELEQLLTQLLRAVSPPAGPDHGNGSAAVSAAAALVPQSRAEDDGSLPAVSASEARALIELVAARGIAQGELAALLNLDKSTVSRLAAGLERKGWVRRGRDEDNQRYVRLYLTPQGGEVAARVWQAWQSRQARILAALSADERAGLSAGLRGLVRGLAAEGLLGEAMPNGSNGHTAS